MPLLRFVDDDPVPVLGIRRIGGVTPDPDAVSYDVARYGPGKVEPPANGLGRGQETVDLFLVGEGRHSSSLVVRGHFIRRMRAMFDDSMARFCASSRPESRSWSSTVLRR